MKKIIAILLIIIAIYLFTNNYYVEYDKIKLSNYECEGDKVIKKHWLQCPPESDCKLECHRTNYPKREERVICINNEPLCICKSTLYNIKIKPFIFN